MASVAEESTVATEIVYHRPFLAGHIYSLAGVGATFEEIVVTWSGSIVEQTRQEMRCEFAAAALVEEVNESGEPHRMELTMFRFGKQSESDFESLLPRMSKVVAVAGEDGFEFSFLDESPLSADAAAALKLLLPRYHSDHGKILESKKKKAKGEKWPGDTEMAVTYFAKNGFVVEKDSLGVVVNQLGDKEVNDIAGTSVLVNMEALRSHPILPPGFELENGSISSRWQLLLPFDSSLPRVDESFEFNHHSIANGTGEESHLKLETTVSTSLQTRCLPFGKAVTRTDTPTP